MVIREATLKETNEILTYSFAVMKEATMGLVQENKDAAVQMMTHTLLNGGYYLVYKERRQLKGWLAIGEYYDRFAEKMAGSLIELYVFPEFRKDGIARGLVQEGISRLKNSGFDKVYLNVYNGNPAKALYKQLGFTDLSTLMVKNL